MTHKKSFTIILLVSVAFALNVNAQQKLSLQEAVTRAKENNPEIKVSNLEVERSHQQTIIARSLLLPSLNGLAQANHFFQLTPFFGFGSTPAGEGKIPYGRFGGQDQFNAALAASQPLFNPLAYPSLRQSRLKEKESQLTLQGKKVSTLSLVKQIYLQVLVLDERIKLQQESVTRNQRALQDARSLFIQGKGLRVDTLRAYTSVKNLEPELLKLRYEVETSKLRLKALMGMDSLQSIELTDSLFLTSFDSIPTENEVYAAAKASNPDLQVVALQEQITEQQVKLATGSRLPVVSAVGVYQVNSQTRKLDYADAHYPTSSYVGLQIAVPLFTGFSNQAKVKQANMGKEQSALIIKDAYEQLRATVHQVVADSHESLARLQTTVTVKEAAELSYNIIQYRYKKGVSSRLELNDAELALSTAQSNYLETVYDHLSARIALEQIMGNVQ